MLGGAVDRLCADWQAPGMPGGAVAVVEDGRVLHRSAYGLADLATGARFTTSDPFPVASVTKQFTALAVLLLSEGGALSLEDEIHRHLPELGDLGAPVTVDHLLRHSSGLRDHITLGTFAGGRLLEGLDRDTIRRLVLSQRSLGFPPGTRSQYSNTNYVLLSWILERLTGLGLGDALDRTVFGPLGMASTRLVADPTRGPATRIRGYVGTARSGFRPWHWTAHMSGEGGVWSTLDDLIRWLDNLAHPRVGSRRTLELMMTPRPLADGSANPYACGLKVGELHGHCWAGHSGGWDGYRSQTVWFPLSRLGVAVLANQTIDPTNAALAAADLVLARRDGTADRMGLLAGSYRSPELDTLCRVVVEDSQLLLSVSGPTGTVDSVPLQRAGEDRYALTRSARAVWDLEFETSFTFSRSPDGEGRALVLDCEWAHGNRFERVSEP